jgi:tyrosine-protein kinase Etk/Wzc
MTTHLERQPELRLAGGHSVLPLPLPLPLGEAPAPAGRDDETGFKSYLQLLFDNRWLIVWLVTGCTLAATVYAFSVRPVYEANMLIHVEENSPNASKNILTEVSSLFETKQAAIAEMELLRSRTVVSSAVDKLRLTIDAEPNYFPVAGFWLAGIGDRRLSEPGFFGYAVFGYGGFVWGGERIAVSQFDVPAPLQGRTFRLTALGRQRYRVSESDSGVIFSGTVGQTISVASPDGPIVLRVDTLAGRLGAEFIVRRSSRLNTIAKIQDALLITEQGKQSGVIEVKLLGTSAAQVSAILGEIGHEYMRLNLARKTEEAEKSLAFLETQLPALKRQLEQSEGQYNRFRNSHGTVNLEEEARISLQQVAEAKTRRITLLQKKTDLLVHFTNNHPLLDGINRQLAEVERDLAEGTGHIRSLPLLEQEQGRLTRDIKIQTDLYTALSNTAQQLRILSVGKVSNVRLVDASVTPEVPVKPNRRLLIGAGAMLGLMLAMVLAFGRKLLQGGIDDPLKLEQLLGARVVYATIPHSSRQRALDQRSRAGNQPLPLLAQAFPDDPAIEILRSFRAALTFSMPHFRNNIVMLTGPTPGLGKSFVSVNFAAVMAASGKRVLLIDADLRNGHLHQYFSTGRERGLSDAIMGAMQAEQVIHHEVLENLDFIATGALPPKRSEFLLHVNFSALLDTVRGNYDLVLIDAPPVLAVSDALVVGAYAGAVFILVRAGVTTEEEVGEAIKRLSQSGIAPQGILFNDLKLRPGAYGYLYNYGKTERLEHAG